MLKIVVQKNPKKSNQDIYDAINQGNIGASAGPVNDPLNELDQFEAPTQEIPSFQSNISVPEPPSYSQDIPDQDVSPSYSIPSFQSAPQQPQMSSDYIQQIVEGVVEEKWDEIISKIGDIRLWKDKIDNDITSIKQEILRTQNNFANLQRGVLGKVSEYNENILNINTEMKALEKVFEKILQPMTENIKELSRITNTLKSKKL